MTGFLAASLNQRGQSVYGVGDFNNIDLSDAAIEYIKNELLLEIPRWYRFAMRYGFLLFIIFLIVCNLIFVLPFSFYLSFMVFTLTEYYYLRNKFQKPFAFITTELICNNPIFSYIETTQRFNKILTERHKINLKEETLKSYSKIYIIKAVRSEAINQIEIKYRRVVYMIGLVLLLLTTYYRYK